VFTLPVICRVSSCTFHGDEWIHLNIFLSVIEIDNMNFKYVNI
jgi:hypothetical protein